MTAFNRHSGLGERCRAACLRAVPRYKSAKTLAPRIKITPAPKTLYCSVKMPPTAAAVPESARTALIPYVRRDIVLLSRLERTEGRPENRMRRLSGYSLSCAEYLLPSAWSPAFACGPLPRGRRSPTNMKTPPKPPNTDWDEPAFLEGIDLTHAGLVWAIKD